MVKITEIEKHVVRAVIRAPSINPKTGNIHNHEILFQIRSGWSELAQYQLTLPGGKIEKKDLKEIPKIDIDNPKLDLTILQMIEVGLIAIQRKLLEELKLVIIPSLFQFVDKSTNRSGWTTWAYAASLAEKPTVVVKPDSGGIRWMDQQQIVKSSPRMLQGHLGITRRALQGHPKKNLK